ncbi:MAG: carboxypeptidase regulatory-like domain-containing protein, partial [Anaerolineae bacterium]
GETLMLALLDEVTGLSLNATYYPMQARDPLTYSAVLPLPMQAVIKYRYARQSSVQVVEDTSFGTPIRYRLYFVSGPGEVNDIISDWSDKVYSRPLGSIQGRIVNADTGAPIPNLLVNAGGEQSFTDSAGRFDLEGLPTGTHNLVIYAPDGGYQTFQQGAVVAEGMNTRVDVQIKSTPRVNVTFIVSVPANTVSGAPIRLAGNLLQLGNTFADLQGGLSTIAERMPTLTLMPDGRYTTTISLPVGAYIQYKYTLGDGFWNAEHKTSGEFVLREFVVPPQDLVLQDQIETWQAGASSPILFEVTVPATTPVGEIIYIQFNPYGWSTPLAMWPLGNNRWAYKLYGPFNLLGEFGYRYCRNAQCGVADDVATVGETTPGHRVSTSLFGQDIQDTVTAWQWLDNGEPTTLVGAPIVARPKGFVTGIELQPFFHPNWSYFTPQAFANIQALGANQVILTPTWSYSHISPLVFEPIPGKDPLWIDTAILANQARSLGLNVAIFPHPHFPVSSADFWLGAPKDAFWWQTWFDHYRAFAVNYADLATQSGAQTLVLGGDWLTPAIPGGSLADGSPSNLPADADLRWKAILDEVRQHFHGQVLWALPFTPGNLQPPLSLLSQADGIYLLWSVPLASQSGAPKDALTNEAGRLLDNEIYGLATILNKPFLLALAYPSVSGASLGCLADGRGGCLDWSVFSPPHTDQLSFTLSLQEQADIYEAILTAVNERPWVGGVISRGYYPPVALRDKSASIHGKPAADILWYWFPRLLGIVK